MDNGFGKKNRISPGKIFYSLLTLSVLFFVGRNFYHALQDIGFGDLSSLKPLNLVLSLLSYILFISGLGLGWIVIQWKGNPLRHLSDMPIYYITAMGKYIPGKIWTAISKERFFSTDKKAGAVGGGFLEIAATVISGTLISSFIIFDLLDLPTMAWVALAVSILILIILLPGVVDFLIRWIGQKIFRKEGEIGFASRRFFAAILIDTGAWIIGGLSLYFLLTAFESKPLSQILNAASVFAASYVVGYLIIFLPAGIGAREQIFAILLGSNPNAYLSALLMRLISLVGDGALALIGLIGRSPSFRRDRR